MFDLFKKRKSKRKLRKSSPESGVPPTVSIDAGATSAPASISEDASAGDFSSMELSESNSMQATPSEATQPLHRQILPTIIGGGEAEQVEEESKSEEEGTTGEDQQEDLGWERKTTEKKEERIAAQLRRRRGLQEEDFTESSMPAKRPVRHGCQKCHLDIEINDGNHRIICDDRGKHYLCKQCIATHIEAWVNVEEEYELRQVRVGSGRGTYALQCISNECVSGCLQEVQLRPLLDPSLYASFRQRLLQARTERTSGSRDAGVSEIGNTATPDQQPPLTSTEQNKEQPYHDHMMAENSRQSLSHAEKELELGNPTSRDAELTEIGNTTTPEEQPPQISPRQNNEHAHLAVRMTEYLQQSPSQLEKELEKELGNPRDLVREWKRERCLGLQKDVLQPYQALPQLEQKILRHKHLLFQQQLGSFRSSLSVSDLPPDENPLTRPASTRRATTLGTSNTSKITPAPQRSSVCSLPCMRGLDEFFDDELPPQPVEVAVPLPPTVNTVPTQVTHPARLSLQQPSGPSFPIGAPEVLTSLVDPVQYVQTLPSDSHHNSSTTSETSTFITCQCCYEEVPVADDASSTITCDPHLPNSEAHSFCAKCVRLYVEEWLFGTSTITLRPGKDRRGKPTLVIPCLFGDCVEGGFPDREVKKALSTLSKQKFKEKISPMRSKEVNDEELLLQVAIRLSLDQQEKQKRVEEMRQEQLELSFSDIPEGLISVGVPAHDDGSASSTSSLPVCSSKTHQRSRRSSKTDPNQENYEKSLHEVEEAMSQAKFRSCPKCKTKFLKDEDFCNKLKCPCCATCVCYICRKVVPSKGYDHFCKHRRGGCKDCADKYCALWTDAEQDDERDLAEMRERGLDIANRIWAESLLENTPGAHPEIRVDVDKILQKPPPSTDI